MTPGPGAASFLVGHEASASLRHSTGALRWTAALVVVGFVGLTAWYTAQHIIAATADPEIAVLVSRGNVTTWPRLVQSFTAAAERHGWLVSEAASENPGRLRIVFGDGGVVLFRLYKELGHGGLRDRVDSLCRRSRPPLAILSGTNSGSARVVAEALHEHEGITPSPLYLLSSGTVDDLAGIHADKTFRFGHKNSRQAKDLVQRMQRLYAEKGKDPPTVRVAIVQIQDDPFACEFTHFVRQELTDALGDGRVAFDVLKLPTAVGPSNEPTELERRNAAKLAGEMASAPQQEWVVVLPGAADFVRRFWLCHYEALQEVGADRMAVHFDNLTYLVGDSIDFVDFNGPLPPSALHATAIFFAQFDPRVGSADSPDSSLVREALYHEIAETVLSVLATPGARESATSLRSALAHYRRTPESPSYFNGPERRGGGGPVVVRAKLDAKFLFDFPPQMK